MKIIIVGDGKVGYVLAQQLTKEGSDIVVIDSNKSVLQEALVTLDVMVVHGNGASLQVQKDAGVESCDLLIAATSADEINLLCCIIARKLGCAHTIARVRNPEYAEQLYFLKEELGLSMVINPERAAANEIVRLLQFPSFLRRDSFAKGKVEIVEIILKENSMLNGKQLLDLYCIAKIRVLVCAVERGEQVYIPDGSFRLEKGDKLYVTAPTRDLAALIKHMGLDKQRIKDVLIVGGSNIAYYLASDLLASGISIKIIENKHSRCTELAEMLPKASIIEADGCSQAILLSEGIEHTDAVVTLTNIDEENLLVSMYANHLKVPKVITKINRTEYNAVFRSMGIDCIVSPKLLTANQIVRYVRALQNTSGGEMITLHRLVDGKVEALEFVVTGETRHLGQTLSSIRLVPNILIACINRGGTIIIPNGETVIEQKDTVIIVTKADRPINALNDIFEEELPANFAYDMPELHLS